MQVRHISTLKNRSPFLKSSSFDHTALQSSCAQVKSLFSVWNSPLSAILFILGVVRFQLWGCKVVTYTDLHLHLHGMSASLWMGTEPRASGIVGTRVLFHWALFPISCILNKPDLETLLTVPSVLSPLLWIAYFYVLSVFLMSCLFLTDLLVIRFCYSWSWACVIYRLIFPQFEDLHIITRQRLVVKHRLP